MKRKIVTIYCDADMLVFFKLEGKFYPSKEDYLLTVGSSTLRQEAITADLGCLMPITDEKAKTLDYMQERMVINGK